MSKKAFNLLGVVVNDDSYCWSTDDVTPKDFSDFLKGCDLDDEIEIVINSPGGHVNAGLAIANMIKAAKQPITARVYGVAASMGSVIACAAPKLAMFRNSFLMIHNPYGYAFGDADEMKKEASVLDSMKAAIIEIYREKFPDTPADALSKLMDDETWILGSEAAACGLKATVEEDPLQAAACITGPAVFAKMPPAATKFYVGKKDMQPIGRVPADSAPPKPPVPTAPEASAPPPDPEPPPEDAAPPAAETPASCQCADLRKQLADANAAAASAENQRRDHQAKADRLTAELAKLKEDHAAAIENLTNAHKAETDKLTATVGTLTAEKTDLEKRINAVTLNALKAPDQACAQTWPEALKECGSFEAAKAKYPNLAEAYRVAHSKK